MWLIHQRPSDITRARLQIFFLSALCSDVKLQVSKQHNQFIDVLSIRQCKMFDKNVTLMRPSKFKSAEHFLCMHSSASVQGSYKKIITVAFMLHQWSTCRLCIIKSTHTYTTQHSMFSMDFSLVYNKISIQTEQFCDILKRLSEFGESVALWLWVSCPQAAVVHAEYTLSKQNRICALWWFQGFKSLALEFSVWCCLMV